MQNMGFLGVPGLFDALPLDMREDLGAMGIVVRYQPGQTIHLRGDRTEGLSIIVSGSVKFGRMDEDGRFIAVAIHQAGQVYGEFTLFAELPRTHDAVAVEETYIRHISKPDFEGFVARNPEMALMLLRNITKQLDSVLNWFDTLRRYPLKVYLGEGLLRLMDADNQVSLTQTDLAEMMGVSRVAIGKVLKEYGALDLVDQKYGVLIIRDPVKMLTWLDDVKSEG